MKYLFIIFTIFMIVSCGGGGSAPISGESPSTPSSPPVITGMQGDISAIEPIDLD